LGHAAQGQAPAAAIVLLLGDERLAPITIASGRTMSIGRREPCSHALSDASHLPAGEAHSAVCCHRKQVMAAGVAAWRLLTVLGHLENRRGHIGRRDDSPGEVRSRRARLLEPLSTRLR
jgi:hypothetical protein